MTIKRYLEAATMTGEVTVTQVLAGEKPSIRLAETPFHVQGGGQKADRGRIGDAFVRDVRQSEDGEIDHFVSDVGAFEAGRTYSFAIDPRWRRNNSNYHSAGHLLAAVCEVMFPGAEAVAGHQWPGEARVDFSLPPNDPELRSKILASGAVIEAAVRNEIARGLPIRIIGSPYVSRACRIGEYPPIPCGGTHARDTSEVGDFLIRSVKGKGSALRIGYALGDIQPTE